MADARYIGSFGDDNLDVDLTFGWFSESIRVHPLAGELTYMDFMARASEVDEEDQAEGVKLTMEFLRGQVHPDDWDLFWRIAREKRQTLEQLMRVSKSIVEAVSGFPTGQPSDSSVGQPPIQPKSKVGSSRQVSSRKRAIEAGPSPDDVTDKAMSHLVGRPDLQLVVAKAAASQVA